MVGKLLDEFFPEETAYQLAPELDATLDGESRSFDIDYDDRFHHIETEPVQIEGVLIGGLVT